MVWLSICSCSLKEHIGAPMFVQSLSHAVFEACVFEVCVFLQSFETKTKNYICAQINYM
jgi:hypothetical protein